MRLRTGTWTALALLGMAAVAHAQEIGDRDLELELLEQQVRAVEPDAPVAAVWSPELPSYDVGGLQCTEDALLASIVPGECEGSGIVVHADGSTDHHAGQTFCFDGDWGAAPPTVLAWSGQGGPTRLRCVGAVVVGKRYALREPMTDDNPVLHVQVWTQRPKVDALTDAALQGTLHRARSVLSHAGRLGEPSGASPSETEIGAALADLFLSRAAELRLTEDWPLAGHVVALRSGAGHREPILWRTPSEPVELFAYDLRSGTVGRSAKDGVFSAEQPVVSPALSDSLPVATAPVDLLPLFTGVIHMWAHGGPAPDVLALDRYEEAVRRGSGQDAAWSGLSARVRQALGAPLTSGASEEERVAARTRITDARIALRAFADRAGELLSAALQANADGWAARQVADAAYTARVLTLRGFNADATYEFAICRAGVACDGAHSPNLGDLTADQPIRLRSHRRFSVALELALDAQSGGSLDYGGYGFVPLGGGEGPSRFYQLAPNARFTDHVSTSVLLLMYPLALANIGEPHLQGLFVGVGTSLFAGDTGDFARQIDFRFGVELVHGLLLSTGPSVRIVDVPAELPVGAVVAVGPDSGAPGFKTTQMITFAWSVGLGLDLVLLGDAVRAVGSAFGGRP